MKDLRTQVLEVLEEIKPYVLSHGGDIQVVKIEEDTVYVRLNGACATCPLSSLTVLFGVEERLKQKIPSVKSVVVVD